MRRSTEEKKSIHLFAIDASKAFDKINWKILLHKLIGKIDEQIWMILYRYYRESIAFVHMDGENLSEIFTTTIGVKKGGPLSPRLFTLTI